MTPSEYVFPGPGLPAEKRVSVEPARVQAERCAGSELELADIEPSPLRAYALEPGVDLAGLRRPHAAVVERAAVAVADHTGPAYAPKTHGCGHLPAFRGDSELRPVHLDELQVEDLPEPGRATLLDDDVAAGLDRDPVGRHLAGEVASVDRGCERQDRLLHRPPDVPVLLAVRLEPIEGIAHSVAPWRFRRNSPRATTIARPPTSTRSIESPLPCAVAKSLEGRPISAPCSTSISAPQSTSPCRQR